MLNNTLFYNNFINSITIYDIYKKYYINIKYCMNIEKIIEALYTKNTRESKNNHANV